MYRLRVEGAQSSVTWGLWSSDFRDSGFRARNLNRPWCPHPTDRDLSKMLPQPGCPNAKIIEGLGFRAKIIQGPCNWNKILVDFW